MELVDDEFNALVENLVGALDKFKVPEKEKGELLGALGPLKPQIVVAGRQAQADRRRRSSPRSPSSPRTLKDKARRSCSALAVIAGKRGQRNYAEQLFSRAEMIAGPKPVASVAATFRAGAPPRITTRAQDAAEGHGAAAAVVGSSDADEPTPPPKPRSASLDGHPQDRRQGPDRASAS